ncbi:MAG: tripartite tricarboxylate transporter substrate binding protein [Burkholderiales bacterium]
MLLSVLHSNAALLAALLIQVIAAPALAQDVYPSRTIRMVVAIPAGSGTDLVARMIAQGLSERLGRQVVVDNRPGAGTIIGNEIVAKAKPDGYTLLMNGAAFTIGPAMYRKLPYDTVRDFAPITNAVSSPNLIAVHPSVPAKSVKEMIALAKAQPGQLLYSMAGSGSNSHLATELFASMARVRLTSVSYRGSTPAVTGLIAGEVALMTTNLSTLLPHVRAGKLRALGIGSVRRIAAAPDIPTISESGLPGYESAQWSGLFAPAGTPFEIVGRLHKETLAVLRVPDNTKRLINDGAVVIANSPEEFAAFIRVEIMKWGELVKLMGIKPE